jgi:hypothetical protein
VAFVRRTQIGTGARKSEPIVNLKLAKALGLAVPPSLLGPADTLSGLMSVRSDIQFERNQTSSLLKNPLATEGS